MQSRTRYARSVGGIGKMEEHLNLPFAGEFSLGYQWKCAQCQEELRSEKTDKTNWQTWYFTHDDRRHYKSKCNIRKG